MRCSRVVNALIRQRGRQGSDEVVRSRETDSEVVTAVKANVTAVVHPLTKEDGELHLPPRSGTRRR